MIDRPARKVNGGSFRGGVAESFNHTDMLRRTGVKPAQRYPPVAQRAVFLHSQPKPGNGDQPGFCAPANPGQ